MLFTPTSENASLTIEVPVAQTGWYDIDVVVTRGPDYGLFLAQVNGEAATIKQFITKHPQGQERYFEISYEHKKIFDARQTGKAAAEPDTPASIASPHVVQRIRLGMFQLDKGTAHIAFIPVLDGNGSNLIGVDQLIITSAQRRDKASPDILTKTTP